MQSTRVARALLFAAQLFGSSSFCRPSQLAENTLGGDSSCFANLIRNLVGGLCAAERTFCRHNRTGSQSEEQSILLLVEIKHYLICCHMPTSYYLFSGMIGRFSAGKRLSLLVRPIMGRFRAAESGQSIRKTGTRIKGCRTVGQR